MPRRGDIRYPDGTDAFGFERYEPVMRLKAGDTGFEVVGRRYKWVHYD
jgi:hypothetical protein